jgi:hypothetical protein
MSYEDDNDISFNSRRKFPLILPSSAMLFPTLSLKQIGSPSYMMS